MKTEILDYIIVVPAQDVEPDEFDKHQGRVINDLQDFYEELDIPMMETYPLKGFLQAINAGDFDIIKDKRVIQVKLEIPEVLFDVLDLNDKVVKHNVNREGVTMYLQGKKDHTQYIVNVIN